MHKPTDPYLWPVPKIYATATHLSTGHVVQTLGPFDTHHAARTAVVETVGRVLIWQRLTTGAYIAGAPPTLWRVEAQTSQE